MNKNNPLLRAQVTMISTSLLRLREKLIRQGTILLGCVLAFGVFTYGLSAWEDDSLKERDTLNQGIKKAEEELRVKDATLRQLKTAMPIYQQLISGKGNADIELTREELLLGMDKLKERHVLSDLRLTLSAVQPTKDPAMSNAYANGTNAFVSLNMRAYTDEFIVAFLEPLPTSLSGQSALQSIMIRRADIPFEEDAKTGRRLAIGVEADIRWNWMGIQTHEQAAPAGKIGAKGKRAKR